MMNEKTNVGLVAWANSWADRWIETIYMLGGFGRKLSWEVRSHFHSLLAKIQSGSSHTIRNQERIKQGIGKYCFDCVGLIKAYLWWDYENDRPRYKTINGVYIPESEGNCNTFWNQATERGKIETMPDIPGILVLIGSPGSFGHVGIYMGKVNGVKQFVEASPGLKSWPLTKQWGVIRTDETMRQWTYWIKFKHIRYLPVVQPIVLKYKVGDRVLLNGHVYSNSAKQGIGKRFDNREATITIISKDALAPYHLDRIGWVEAKSVGAIPDKPSPFVVAFKVGDRVKIKSTATHYLTGQRIPSWVKLLTYTVKQSGSVKYPTGVLLSFITSWVSSLDVVKK